jgi:hypothetical protein
MVMSKTGKGEKGTMGAVLLVIAFILSIVSFNWLGTPFFLLAAIFGFIAKPKQGAVEVEAATEEQPPADVSPLIENHKYHYTRWAASHWVYFFFV